MVQSHGRRLVMSRSRHGARRDESVDGEVKQIEAYTRRLDWDNYCDKK